MSSPARVVVAAIGNDLRGDDGAGIEVGRRLQRMPGLAAEVHLSDGDLTDFLELCSTAATLLVVDAMAAGVPPGTIARFDPAREPIPNGFRAALSSHAIGLAEGFALAAALGRLPERVVVYGIAGECWTTGAGMSPGVAGAIPHLTQRLRQEVAEAATR